jgi:hypothetical protein
MMTSDKRDRDSHQFSKDAVHLSVDARDIARACGMSEVEYARQVLKLREMKKRGLIQQS